MTISTSHTRYDTVNDILSKDSTGIRNDLWKSATDTDNNGPIKAIGYLCSYSVAHMTRRNDTASKKLLDDSYSVAHMTSRNDAATKKLLDALLNHGEFRESLEK